MQTNKRTLIIALGGLAVVLLVVAIGSGVYNTRAKSTPNEVVERFYGSWIKARAEGPNAPIEAGLHEKSTYVTEDFAHTIASAAERGKDAVLCGALPTGFTAQEAKVNEERNIAGVRFTVGTTSARAVLTRDERKFWRIDEVDCPRVEREDTGTTTPQTASSTEE
jgi:hypothetical protein